MPNAFVLFGELKADTNAFQNSLRDAEARLKSTEKAIDGTERKAQNLGETTNQSARAFERMRESLNSASQKLRLTAEAFSKGQATATQMRNALLSVENASARLNSKLKDSEARVRDLAASGGKLKSAFGGGIGASFLGNLSANVFTTIIEKIKDLASEGIKLNNTFDKTARYVGTVDDSLKNTTGLNQFKQQLKELSVQLPYTAEQFAKASYTITSGLQVFGADRLKVLQEIGKAAAAANVPVEDFADNVTGLLVGYKVPIQDLEKTFAALNSSIGKSIVTDQEYLSGLNKLAPKAIQTGQSMQTLLGAMAALTTDTKDASGAFTNLENVLSKIFDAKYKEGLQEVFGVSFYDAAGNVKQLNVVIEELASKMQGLTKEEQISKIGSVFKDAQARDGILALINNIDKYKKALADGSDVDKFRQNQTQMLDATEARWKQFYANIENAQTGFGARISNDLLSAFDSATVTGGIAIFFNNIGGAILEGVAYLIQQNPFAQFGNWVASWFFSDETNTKVSQQQDKFFKSLIDGIRSNTENNRNQIIKGQQSLGASAVGALADGMLANQGQIQQSGQTIGNTVTKSTSSAIEKNKSQVTQAVNNLSQINPNPFFQSGFGAGSNMGQGVVVGINSKLAQVRNAAALLGFAADAALSTQIQAQSPAKVFIRLGEYIGDGLAIGMLNRRDDVSKSSTDLFKAVMASAKSITAKIKEQVKELTKQLKELNLENAVAFEGFTQTIGFRVSLAEGEKLKNQMQEIIDLQLKLGISPILDKANLEGQLSGLQKLDKTFSAITETMSDLTEFKPDFSDMLALFSDEKAQKGLDDLAKKLNLTREALFSLLTLAKSDAFFANIGSLLEKLPNAPFKTDGEFNDKNTVKTDLPEISAIGEIAPQIKQKWQDFFATFRQGIESMKAGAVSIKQSLGENLLNSIGGIADVFGNAAQSWDLTLRGFFQSVAQGFAQMAKQIIADMVRMMIYKGLLKLFGSLAGSFGASSAGDIGGGGVPGAGSIGGHAQGGMIRGRGTGTSDSIFARLSNGEFVMKAAAVKHWGASFFESLNNMVMPQTALASGGYVGAMPSSNYSNTYNNQRSNVFNISVSGGSEPQNRQSAAMVKRAISDAIRKEEMRRK